MEETRKQLMQAILFRLDQLPVEKLRAVNGFLRGLLGR